MRNGFLAICRGCLRVGVLLFLLLFSGTMSEGAVHCVDVNAGGANDGTSWTDAFIDLQSALSVAMDGDEIWVAAGSYTPTNGIDRTISFVLKNGVALYGGFAGTETSRGQRDWSAHETVLSGNIGAPGTNTDNSYHVVVGSGTNATAVLDGFTVLGGYADGGSHEQKSGGGMLIYNGSPTVRNCLFLENTAEYHGGGMFIWWDQSSPSVTNCTFSGNSANWGGGMCAYLSGAPRITDCTFSQNSASGYGGGMHIHDGGPEVVNSLFWANSAQHDGGGVYTEGGSKPKSFTGCTFSQNSAGENGGGLYGQHSGTGLAVTACTFFGNNAQTFGGGMYNWAASSPAVTNCTFSGNGSTEGGGMCNSNWSNPTLMNCTFSGNISVSGGKGLHNRVGSAPVATNCIFWGAGSTVGQILNENTASLTVTFSITDQTGTGNLAGDPMLGPLADNGGPARTHALRDGSTALDAGTLVGAPATDQRGVSRPQGSAVDMGAFEKGGSVSPTPTQPPSGGGGGGGCDAGFSPFALLLVLPLVLSRRW